MAPDGEPGTAATGRHEASFAAFFAVVLDGVHVTLSRTYIHTHEAQQRRQRRRRS